MDRAEAIRKIEYGLEMETTPPVPAPMSFIGVGQLTVVSTDALKVALAALREQEQGCEWCSSLDKKNKDFKCGDLCARGVVEHTFWGDGRMYSQIPNFCPMCGRKLKEGAE